MYNYSGQLQILQGADGRFQANVIEEVSPGDEKAFPAEGAVIDDKAYLKWRTSSSVAELAIEAGGLALNGPGVALTKFKGVYSSFTLTCKRTGDSRRSSCRSPRCST